MDKEKTRQRPRVAARLQSLCGQKIVFCTHLSSYNAHVESGISGSTKVKWTGAIARGHDLPAGVVTIFIGSSLKAFDERKNQAKCQPQ